MNEHQLQVMAINAFRAAGLYAFSITNHQQALSRVPKCQRFALINSLKSEGMTSGVADMQILLPGGRSIFIETKAPEEVWNGKKRYSGKQSDEQKKFEAKVTALGHRYIVLDSIVGIEEIITEAKRV